MSATLLMRSFAEVRRVNPGFNSERVYTAHLAIPRAKYRTDRDVAAFGDRLVARVRALPDVLSVGMVNRLPLAGGAQTGPIAFEGIDSTSVGLKNVDFRSVTPDYFRTLEIPLVSGRSFTEADNADTLVAIIDDQLAKLAFPHADPLGHRVRMPVGDEPWMRIVGVVGHIRHDRLEEDVRPQIYFTNAERTQDRMALAVRTRGEPSSIAASVMSAIRAVDPEQPVYDARPLDAVIDRSLGQRRLQTVLLGAFASIALLLAASATAKRIAVAAAKLGMSKLLTLNSRLPSTRALAAAATRPMALPATNNVRPRCSTLRTISPRRAPRARRMPNSRRRWPTAYAITP